jgi:serine/threonine protein kinase/tetratricopeptide (TPR) repeat protein
LIGKTISQYQILEKLGQGGMGVVYKALDTNLNRYVALKFLPSHLTQEESTRKRFTMEAQAASALDHPNICSIHEINETADEQLYICMGYYKGESLREKIKRGPIPLSEALNIIFQIAQGLKAAHEENIIHRDIKPGNILITEKGEVKIVDFGLAKLAGIQLTQASSGKGTAAYMCPEQIRGKKVDRRCDIWALGVVFYEMLTGHIPFQEEYPEPMMYAIVNEEPISLTHYLKDTPESVQAIIDKSLKKDPNKRYKEVREILNDLKKIPDKSTVTTLAEVDSYSKRLIHPLRTPYGMIGSIIIIIMIALAGFYFFLPQDNSAHYPFTTEEWKRIEEARNRDFVIAVLPFWGVDDEAIQEGKVMQALISRRLYDELGQEPRIKIISPNIEKFPRTDEKVREISKNLPANLFIWGEVYILRDEVEIQPYLTTTKEPSYRLDLNIPYEISALEASLTGVSKLTFRRAKAEEIGNIIISIAGHYYIQNRNYGKALLILKRIQPPSSQSLVLLGDIYFLKGERNVADSLYQLAVTLDPGDPLNYLHLAKLYNEDILFQKALQSVKKSLSIDPDLALAYDILGNIYGSMGKLKEMQHALEKGLQLDTSNISLYLSLAARHFEDRNYDQTIYYIKKAIKINPAKPTSYLSLGSTYNRIGQYDETVKIMQKVTELNPLEAEAYRIRGYAYQSQGKYKLAERQYLKAIKLNDSNELNFLRLAFLYLFQQKYQQAIPLWEKTIKLTPNSPFWWRWLARTYVYQGKYKKARLVLQEFLEQVPSSESATLPSFFSEMGLALELQGEFEKALEYYQKGIEMLGTGRGFGVITSRYYFLLNQLGKTNEATDLLKRSINRLNRGSKIESWEMNALIYLLGEISETELFQRANNQSPQLEKMYKIEAYYIAGKKYLLKSSLKDTISIENRNKAYNLFRKCWDFKDDPQEFFATEIILAQRELGLMEGMR